MALPSSAYNHFSLTLFLPSLTVCLQFPDPVRTYLLELFEQYVEKGLQFVLKNCTQAICQVDISKVTTLCSLLEALLLSKEGPDLKMVH